MASIECDLCARVVMPRDGVAFLDNGQRAHVPCYVDGAEVSALGDRSSPDFLRGIHLLIVEDNADTLELLASALEYCGAFVTSAATAIHGKRLLRDIAPHVIVTDISMPDDGFAMVAEVLAFSREIGSQIPAIAITGTDDLVDNLHNAGFAAYIAKPLDPFVLAVLAEKLVRSARGRP